MLRTHDPVVSDLARHLAEQDRREAREAALDAWLECHGGNDILDLIEEDPLTPYKLANRLHRLMAGQDASQGRAEIRGLFIEMVEHAFLQASA